MLDSRRTGWLGSDSMAFFNMIILRSPASRLIQPGGTRRFVLVMFYSELRTE
jgi:hypothetical protein